MKSPVAQFHVTTLTSALITAPLSAVLPTRSVHVCALGDSRVNTTTPVVAFEKANDSRDSVDFVGCVVVAAAAGVGREVQTMADEQRSSATEVTLTSRRITRRLVAPPALGITADISGRVGDAPKH